MKSRTNGSGFFLLPFKYPSRSIVLVMSNSKNRVTEHWLTLDYTSKVYQTHILINGFTIGTQSGCDSDQNNRVYHRPTGHNSSNDPFHGVKIEQQRSSVLPPYIYRFSTTRREHTDTRKRRFFVLPTAFF